MNVCNECIENGPKDDKKRYRGLSIKGIEGDRGDSFMRRRLHNTHTHACYSDWWRIYIHMCVYAFLCCMLPQAHAAVSSSSSSSSSSSTKPWNLPVLPPKGLLPPSTVPSYNYPLDTEKYIPRHLWIALHNRSDELSWQMPKLFARNLHWSIHLEGNSEKG